MTKPRVSVVISVYNGAEFLQQSIQSILDQTFSDFELIVIDDGSTDDSMTVAQAFRDPRIRTILNTENKGGAYRRRQAVDMAEGEYIAQQDADDFSLPERLRLQVNYLDGHPEVGFLGTGAFSCHTGKINDRPYLFPLTDLEMRWRMVFGIPTAHSTLMVRKSVIEQHQVRYDPAFRFCFDYDFYERCLEFTRGANLPVGLVVHRIHSNQMTKTNRPEQFTYHLAISRRILQKKLPEIQLSDDDLAEICHMLIGREKFYLATAKIEKNAIQNYLRAYRMFLQCYGGWPIVGLRDPVLADLARMCRRRPRNSGWLVRWAVLEFLAVISGITRGWFYRR